MTSPRVTAGDRFTIAGNCEAGHTVSHFYSETMTAVGLAYPVPAAPGGGCLLSCAPSAAPYVLPVGAAQ